MKVLILSTGTGEGHNSAAKAVKEQFDENGIPCVMADALDFASERAARYGRNVYVWSTKRGVFGGAYRAGSAITSARHKSPVYYANALYADKLYAYIVENDFDTVVMPHLFPAEAVTYMQKKHHLRLASYFIATDYTCIPFTEETSPDYFFIPHEDLIPEFAGRGIPEEKLIPLGIPVSGRFVELPPREECRGRLGIPEGRRCILLMTGSMGYGNVESMVAKLWERTGEDTCIYVMGGTNEKLKAALRQKYSGQERVVVLDFTDRAQEYMAAADVLFTKPGGLTSTEAVAAGVPLVHTHPIPGCEVRNAAFFTARGMSVSDRREDAVIQKGLELLESSSLQDGMRAAQKKYGKPDAARRIYEFIVEHSV
ncbi:MAG: glycosyltransferase [Acetatifactor sp.]|nr:glycosyltransferase [Acetatifactor sp.]